MRAVALLLVVVGVVCGQTDPQCLPLAVQDPVSGSTLTYDIRGMKVSDTDSTQLYIAQESGAGWTIFFNICGDAKSAGCSVSTPGCQNDGSGKFFQLGTPQSFTLQAYYAPSDTTKKTIPNGGVFVQTNGGDQCGNQVNRQMNMWLKCDPSTTGRPAPVNVKEQDPGSGKATQCQYFFDPIPNAQFCPGAGGGGFDYGWIFVIIVLCGLFLYFVVGIIICKFAMHKEGREVVPHVDFWTALPGLVFDGLKWTFCCVPCRGGGGYTEV